MKSIFKFSWLLLLVTLTVVSCRSDKDIPEVPTEIPVTPPEDNVTASVFGLVKDQNGAAIADARVSIDGNTITQTDVNGVFVTPSMTLNSLGSNITVNKSGFFLGSKFVQPTEGGSVYSELTLVTRTLTQTIDAATGATVTANGGATVQFSPNGIEDANGNVFTGAVNVYAYWYNPTAENLTDEMPGDLRAVNSANQFQQLATYGMMAVELESASGAPLNIADGATASMIFPVPSTMTGDAPASIPLWFFDEGSGYWLEDGAATKVGDTYSAEVSHFTWWNCDIPYNFIDLSGTVTDANGTAWSNASIKFTDSNALCGYAYTDIDGNYSLKVPKNEILTMEIFDNCGDIIHTEEIGPYTADAVHDVSLTITLSNVITINAELVACAGNPAITEGYFKVDFGGGDLRYIGIDATGFASYTFNNCDGYTSAVITGVDFTNNYFSMPLTITIPTSGPVDAGSIMTCDVNPETWTFDRNGLMGYAVNSNIGDDSGLFATGNGPDSNMVSFSIVDSLWTSFPGVGMYNPTALNLFIYDGMNGGWEFLNCSPCVDVTMNITEYGTVGERIKGNWSGTVSDATGTTISTNGDFDLIRDY